MTAASNSRSWATSRYALKLSAKQRLLTFEPQSHQNKFHSQTLRHLTTKFANFQEGDLVTPQDKTMWEYFASLYKNSNKGIKGRGKDRKVHSPVVSSSPRADSTEDHASSSSSSSIGYQDVENSVSPDRG